MISKTRPQLRPALVNRVRAENPNVKELDGPVLKPDDYISAPALQRVGMASQLFPIVPQAMENAEKQYPAVAKLLGQAQNAVFSTLALEGAVIGLALGESDRHSSDTGVVAASLHALSLKEPYIAEEPLGTLYIDNYDRQAYIHLTADKVSVDVPAPVHLENTQSRDLKVLQTVRDLFEEADGRLGGAPAKPNSWGKPTKDGKLLLEFDYGTPKNLGTPSGEYSFATGSTMGKGHTSEKFKELLNEKFDLRVVTPQRDDSALDVRSHVFQDQYSGPVLELQPKNLDALSPFRELPESMRTPQGFDRNSVQSELVRFLAGEGNGDRSLTAQEATTLREASRKSRGEFEAMDKGETVGRLKDTNPEPGVVEYEKLFKKYQVDLDDAEVRVEGTSEYGSKEFRIERQEGDRLVGIELRSSGRYAEGKAYSVDSSGGRVRDLFYKEKMPEA